MKKLLSLLAVATVVMFSGCVADKKVESNTTEQNVTVEQNTTESNATESNTTK